MKIFIFSLLLTVQAYAQVFTTSTGDTRIHFSGSILKEASNRKSSIIFRNLNNGSQEFTLILEMADFSFPSEFQSEVFHDAFESFYFPQMRFKGVLKDAINLNQEGSQTVSIPMTVFIRKQSFKKDLRVSFEVQTGLLTVHMDETMDMRTLNVPYAGQGSEIGESMKMRVSAELMK